MRNAKVPGVPVSMLNNFGVTDTSHHHDTAESSRDMKRRHSDDVTAAAKLAKKTPRSEKKEKGKRCFPCANSNRECDNSSPCQRCGKDNSTHYPVCISPDFSDHNIFVEGLSPELKTRAMDIIATDTEMSIDESSMAHIFRVLAEYKTGYPSFYDPFLMHGPKTAKFFVTPFHQASLMLQSYDFLESRSKDPHYAHLSLESENNLRLWRAVKATSALKFITAMMDKNRMPRETPKLSYHARYLVVNLAIIFEQTEAYEKTMAAGTTMSEALKEQHRHLLYHLAYRLRRMSDHAFRPESQLSKSVIIKKDMVRLDKGFWDKLEELWTTPAAEDEEALACSATTAPATCLSAVTPIDMDFSTTAAMGHVFSATQPSSTLMPPAMQRLGSRSSHIRKKAPQKPKKERERREDDKWDDERDGLDANTMVAVRCPIRDSVEEFVDLINRMHIHDPIPVSAPDDDGTVFLTGGMDANNMWTTDVGSPIDFLGDIYTANDDYQTNDVDMRRHDSAVEAENEASNSQAPDIRSGGVDALGSMSDLDGMVGRGIDRVDSLDYEKYLAASLQQAQAEDNANPNYNYNRLSAGPSPSTLQLPATSCPTSPLPGSSSILSTSRPATAASASSANSGNVSAARRAAQARPSGPPSRTRSVIDKGKGVMKNIFRY
ncbi:hypothetical protein SCUCBS95973_009509 [Sporothrix curviconia]|uniref:Zn(2)-C6 fungal-type domain-containing protein n=1 Tax=Sporothrix curviconia TaxID=1260050 RepID=A0ABP0CWI4_9PEZI